MRFAPEEHHNISALTLIEEPKGKDTDLIKNLRLQLNGPRIQDLSIWREFSKQMRVQESQTKTGLKKSQFVKFPDRDWEKDSAAHQDNQNECSDNPSYVSTEINPNHNTIIPFQGSI